MMISMKKIWILLATLCLAACQVPWLTDLVVPAGGSLYQDDFSDPQSGWPVQASEQGQTGYAWDAYVIQVLVPNYDLWAVAGQTFRDVRVEVTAARTAGPVQNRIGLVCRYLDPGNYYFFIISSDGYYTVGKLRDGVRSLLGQEMMAYSDAILPGEAANRLRFECIGQVLSGYVNDRMIAVTSDPDLGDGDAGLLAGAFDEGGLEVRFDDFVVIKP